MLAHGYMYMDGLPHSSPYFLKHGLLLSLGLTDSARLAG